MRKLLLILLLYVNLRELNPFYVSNRRFSRWMNAVKSIRDMIDNSANPTKESWDDKKKFNTTNELYLILDFVHRRRR